MKYFFYTIVLSFVLIASVMYLYSIQTHEPEPDVAVTPAPTPRETMVVKSVPAQKGSLAASELENLNRDALYTTGVELLDLWHLPEAIGVLRRVVDKDSTHCDAYLKLVECYSHPIVGDERLAEEAWADARRAAAATEGDTLWVAAFRSLFITDFASVAVNRFEELAEGDADETESTLYLAMALFRAGRIDEAEDALESLLELDSSLGRARELLVRCKIARGEFGEAESLTRDLAAIYPREPYPYVLLSRVQLVLGNIDSAAEFCNSALLLDERYIPAIVARAHIYAASDEWEAAKVSFEKLHLFDDPVLAAVGFEGIAYVHFLSGAFDQGSQAMDEAIRLAMSGGANRRGLLYAFRQVDYLCELGRFDAAAAVLDRWVSRQGSIPSQLGKLRVRIAEGNVDGLEHALDQIRDNRRWRSWMRALAIDYDDFAALAYIEDNNFAKALEALNAAGAAVADTRRAYLKGYASFEVGDAETAANAFEEAQIRFHTIEFPYHSDPVLYVQSKFLLAEASVARGEYELARQYYNEFLGMWGKATWQLQAVDRAREKVETLSGEPLGG